MPAVNAGPSNSATQNTTAGMVAAPSASNVSGGLSLAQTGIGVGIAPTGTMGANGAVTMGTALSGIYSSGAYFYYPAGAVFASSIAGFYFTKMSSTTVGTVFNNLYVAANGLPTVPATLVAVSDAGPGAFTGVTTVQTAIQFTVPGNVIGANGALQYEVLYSYPNSAGNKTLAATFGGTNFLSFAATTTLQGYFFRSIINRGIPNSQVSTTTAGFGFGTTANAVVFGSVDTTQAQTFAFNLTIAVATDFVVLESLRVAAFYGQ